MTVERGASAPRADRARPRRTAVTATASVLTALALTWLLAEGLVLVHAHLGLRPPSVVGVVAAFGLLHSASTPLGRQLLAAGLRRWPVPVALAVLGVTWLGSFALRLPEVFPVAGAGVAHFVLQVRPRRPLLGLLLGALTAGTAAVVVATAVDGSLSLVARPVGGLLVVGLLLFVAGQVSSSLDLARGAELSASSLREQEDERVRELRHAAAHDALTGALNRRGLFEELGPALTAPSCGTAVVFLDLDGFKAVNDVHGHDVGDELLVAVAARLRTALRQLPRQADLLARLGGDEFVVVLVEVPSPEVAERVVERLRAAVTAPVRTSVGEVSVGVSTGMAHTAAAGGGEVTAEVLLRVADERMYAEKGARRRSVAAAG